jgi:PKD repeat protein
VLPLLQLSCVDLSGGSISSWTWDWGDGSLDAGSNPPTHTYSSDISPVTVRLTVSGPGGTDFVDHTFTLNPNP